MLCLLQVQVVGACGQCQGIGLATTRQWLQPPAPTLRMLDAGAGTCLRTPCSVEWAIYLGHPCVRAMGHRAMGQRAGCFVPSVLRLCSVISALAPVACMCSSTTGGQCSPGYYTSPSGCLKCPSGPAGKGSGAITLVVTLFVFVCGSFLSAVGIARHRLGTVDVPHAVQRAVSRHGLITLCLLGLPLP